MKDFNLFKKERFENACMNDTLQATTMYDYIAVYYVALLCLCVFKGLEFVSSYTFFVSLFAKFGEWAWLVSIVIQALIELVIVGTFSKFFDLFFRHPRKIDIFLLMVGILGSALMMYASVMGAGDMIQDKKSLENVGKKYDTEINDLRKEIAQIQHRNSWQGNTYITGEEKNLLMKKESELSIMKAKKANTLSIEEAKNENLQKQAQWWMAGFELCFLVCFWYIRYFTYRIGIEKAIKLGKIGLSQKQYTPTEDYELMPDEGVIVTKQLQKKNYNSLGMRNYEPIVERLKNGFTIESISRELSISANTISKVKKIAIENGEIS